MSKKYLDYTGLTYFKEKLDETYVKSSDLQSSKMYEHRICYNATRTSSDTTYWWRLEFSFVNSVSTPYLTADMTSFDDIIEGLQNVFDALDAVISAGDYVNSNISQRMVPCTGFYSGSSTYVFVAFMPSLSIGSSTFTLFMSYITADSVSKLTTFSFMCDSSTTMNVEDNVREMSTGVGQLSVSTETDDDGNVILVLGGVANSDNSETDNDEDDSGSSGNGPTIEDVQDEY